MVILLKGEIPINDKLKAEMALFRFSLIAPIVNGTINTTAREYMDEICAKPIQIPGVGIKVLSPNTVRRWLSEYRRFGLEGLKRKSRNDKGLARNLNSEMAAAIKEIKQLHPDKTVTSIYYELLNQGILGDPPISLSTMHRFVRKLDFREDLQVERKRFAFFC